MPNSASDSAADSVPAPASVGDWTEETLWERLRAFVWTPPLSYQLEGVWKPDGVWESNAAAPYPPASEEQLRQTEAELGLPLPPDLRRFYAEIANGGHRIGPVDLLYGASGGCPSALWGSDSQKTVERLVSHSGWRLHPRIEEALLRHPGCYVYVDSLPEGFLLLGQLEGYPDVTVLDTITGRIYMTSYPYWFNVLPASGAEQDILISWLSLESPSLGAWFDRWLGAWAEYTGYTLTEPGQMTESEPLTADQVETANLPDPGIVWRGLYRFGRDWWEEQPVEDGLIENINQWINEGDTADD